MTPKLTAGRRLRIDLDKALAHASQQGGYQLEWSEQELHVIAQACDMADRAEVLKEMFAAEETATTKLKIATELRHTQRSVVELVAKVHPGDGRAKSQRHVKAVAQRWDRKRQREA
ncbi:hypothetical protein ACAG25_07385 [Mycobacterium sp. pV006]|uniref:hypothetical protein n=1 Tax=Mycobacterium sp. pV006 TaxID=3238983 RepID=UPI00351AB75A